MTRDWATFCLGFVTGMIAVALVVAILGELAAR